MNRTSQPSRSSAWVAPDRKTSVQGTIPDSRSTLRMAERIFLDVTRARGPRRRRECLQAALLLTACLLLSPVATSAVEPGVAIRAEGYLGYSSIDLINRVDAFQGGGSGSVSLTVDRLYVQGDVFGDVMDFEENVEARNVGSGLHLGWRDPERGNAGVVGAYNSLKVAGTTFDVIRAGFEAAAYLDQLTIGLTGGYLDLDGADFVYLDALFAFYPTERARLNLGVGATGIEGGSPLIDLAVGGELLLTEALAPFLRWEGTLPKTFADVLQHSIVAGLTFYWGGDTNSLQGYDRNYFNSGCRGTLIGGRLC